MGIAQMRIYQYFWSEQLRYQLIVDVMALKRSQQLWRFLHFVDNRTQNDVNAADKLLKIKPTIDMVWQQYMKVEPEESHSVDE